MEDTGNQGGLKMHSSCVVSPSLQPRDESHRAGFKTYHMPPLDRKRGGY